MTQATTRSGRAAKIPALFLVIALLLGLFPGRPSGGLLLAASAAGRDVRDQVELVSLEIQVDGGTIYEYGGDASREPVTLEADSVLKFQLEWQTIGDGNDFADGDSFTIPVVEITNLRLDNPYRRNLTIQDDDGESIVVAEGKFVYEKNQLLFQVEFNEKANGYYIDGGSAGGSAGFNLSGGPSEIPIHFEDGQSATLSNGSKDPGKVPDLPKYPDPLPPMRKAVLSGVSGSGEVDTSKTYDTIPAGSSKKVGLDWRLTFFDLLAHFRSGDDSASEYVIIEDKLSANQSFSNFRFFHSSGRDKGFDRLSGRETQAPFFIEIPVVAVGSDRLYNIAGGNTLKADSSSAYIRTYIRADQLTQITGGSIADDVRANPLSWGIVQDADGETLLINLGRLGPDIAQGEGLTADLIVDGDLPYDVIDNQIMAELLTAQQALGILGAGGRERDIDAWKQVRREAVQTLLHYWPGLRDKLCDILEIAVNSTTAEIEQRLDEMSDSELQATRLDTLGYDNRGLSYEMRIDCFALRYRTVVEANSTGAVSNQAEVTTGVVNLEYTAEYKHEFDANIVGSVGKGEIAFVKADSLDGHPAGIAAEDAVAKVNGLAGFVFEVYEQDGSAPLAFSQSGSGYRLQTGGSVTRLETDSSGAFTITGLSPAKTYYLKEVDGPDGYYLDQNQKVTFRVNRNSSQYCIVANVPRAVRLTKTDVTTGKGLSGATFALYTSNDKPVTGFVREGDHYRYNGSGSAELTTPSGGVLELRGLPAGDYYFREAEAPGGYRLTDQKIAFTLAERLPAEKDRLVNLGEITNRKATDSSTGDNHELAVYKVDEKTGKRLRGAKFRLRYPDGSTQEKTTNSDGIAVFPLDEKDYAGTYAITEFLAPEGYRLNSGDVTFTIGTDQKLDLKGSYTHVQKVDEDTGLRIENTAKDSENPSKPDDGSSSKPGGSKEPSERDRTPGGTDKRDTDKAKPTAASTGATAQKKKTTTPSATQTGEQTANLDEPGVPLANVSEDEIPLASLPETGLAHPGLRTAALLAAGSALATCLLLRRKRR